MTITQKPRKAYHSNAFQETYDRLKVPRTNWVFNKQDSTVAVPDTHRFCLERGQRQYELTNHTGDVLATITDRKIPVDSDPDSLVDFYRADIITADDYYPFGMPMPSRHWQADSADQYRFGFQGMRKGNQLYGDGNLYETPFRNYDPRLGRWLSPDPIQHPWQGSYTAFNNNPIYYVDPMGLSSDTTWTAGLDKPVDIQADRQTPSGTKQQMTAKRAARRAASTPDDPSLKSNRGIELAVKQDRLSQDQLNADLNMPERIYTGGDLSCAVGEGVKFEAQVNWLLEGKDASLLPYVTIEAGAGAGYEDLSADGVLGAQWYTRDKENYPLTQERLSGGSLYSGSAVEPYPLPFGIAGEYERGYGREMQTKFWEGGEIGISTTGPTPIGGMAGYNQTLVNIHLWPW